MAGEASACAFTAWGNGETAVTGAPVAGSPRDGAPTARYSGKCASKSPASGAFVSDGSPGTEPKYEVLFYVYTGLASGQAQVFRAEDPSNVEKIGVTYDADAGKFSFKSNGGTAADISGIVKNKWYGVSLDWNAGQPMAVKVRGGNSFTVLTANAAGSVAGDRIDGASLGWISGAGTTDGTHPGIITDAFVSQRATLPAFLKRADSNNDSVCNASDITALARDIVGTLVGGDPPTLPLAPGQPDCNEDGVDNASDITCSAVIIIADLLNGSVCGVAP
jgi:hypothetical protein